MLTNLCILLESSFLISDFEHYMRKRPAALLEKFLSVLVEEYGQDAVRVQLEALVCKAAGDDSGVKPVNKLRSRQLIGAVEQARQVQASMEVKAALVSLATDYEKKSFLPSMRDIRSFIEMNGGREKVGKDRQDAFRAVLEVLQAKSIDGIHQIAESSEFRGPSQLGPLSDAIKAVGATFRREDAESQSEGNPAQPEKAESKTSRSPAGLSRSGDIP